VFEIVTGEVAELHRSARQSMKKMLLVLVVCSVAALCPANGGEVKRSSRIPAVITCFNGKLDIGTSCTVRSIDVSDNTSTCKWSHGLTCGPAGQVSELRWKLVRSEGDTDVYLFSRRFPADSQRSETVTREVAFSGSRVVVFEDQFQVIVIDLDKGKNEK
jgi:hypothetical protein